jgi:hypothetical protein
MSHDHVCRLPAGKPQIITSISPKTSSLLRSSGARILQESAKSSMPVSIIRGAI